MRTFFHLVRRSHLTRLRMLWLCLMAIMIMMLMLGEYAQASFMIKDVRGNTEVLILEIGVLVIVFLLVVFVMFASSLIFWKAEATRMGLLLALALLFYWTTDSSPFDLLTKPEYSPFAPFFAPPILMMRAASLPLALALLFTFPDGQFSPRWTRCQDRN